MLLGLGLLGVRLLEVFRLKSNSGHAHSGKFSGAEGYS
jgi:hypothetical protein